MKTYLKPSISILGCETLGAKLQGTGLLIVCEGNPNCDYKLGADCWYIGNDQFNLSMTVFSNSSEWSGCSIYVNGNVIDAESICDREVLDPSCSFPLIGGGVIEGAIYQLSCMGDSSDLPCSSVGNSIYWNCEGTELPCAD